jgi:hypothetical protein
MICENCKSEFNSLNWFRYIDKDRMVLCDNCLIDVFKFQIQILQSDIGIIKEKIKNIKFNKSVSEAIEKSNKKHSEMFNMLTEKDAFTGQNEIIDKPIKVTLEGESV